MLAAVGCYLSFLVLLTFLMFLFDCKKVAVVVRSSHLDQSDRV
jgi:hypothetical protein